MSHQKKKKKKKRKRARFNAIGTKWAHRPLLNHEALWALLISKLGYYFIMEKKKGGKYGPTSSSRTCISKLHFSNHNKRIQSHKYCILSAWLPCLPLLMQAQQLSLSLSLKTNKKVHQEVQMGARQVCGI